MKRWVLSGAGNADMMGWKSMKEWVKKGIHKEKRQDILHIGKLVEEGNNKFVDN